MQLRSTTARLCAIAAITAAILIATAGSALAAPGDPTLGLVGLQAKLDASPTGSVMGYLKTVDKGSTIETIPVEVLAVTGDDPASSLILFEAQGPKIDKFGGIVAGMSGSPVYVPDGGVDKVIGALSYGDYFTIGGSGLATPIEAMLKIQSDYAPRVQVLSSPVIMSGRVVDEVIVPADASAYGSAAQAGGAFVAKPLSQMYIGGLNPKSALFEGLKKKLEAHGQSVLALDAPLSAGASTFTTDLVPGAAVGALYSRGDLWLGGLGTVTYTSGNDLLAFGHPLDWTGATSVYLTNAWITGVWPSQERPYKMGYPSAIRGTFTQDRNAGILGVVGQVPTEVPVTAHATDADTGREATSAVYFTSKLFDDRDTSDYASYAASVAVSKLFDQYTVLGSALTTTTVVVSDGLQQYTVKIPNVVDSSDQWSDLTYMVGDDVDYAVSSLLSVLDYGLQQPHIVSVDLEATVSHVHRSAEIVGVAPETSLKVGDNRIKVSLLAVGVAETQTVDATITIPVGTPVSGQLVALSDFSDTSGYPDTVSSSRETIAQVVDDLNASVPNNMLFVNFIPESQADSSGDGPAVPAPRAVRSVETSIATPWYTTGSARVTATELTAFTSPVPRGSWALVTGEVFGPEKRVLVSVFGTTVGTTTERLLESDTATVDPDTGSLSYEIFLPDEMFTNTALRVHVDAGDGYTAADTYVMQLVRASVRIRTSANSVKSGKKVTLSATVTPGSSTGTVNFQFYDPARHAWRTVGTRTLAAAKASLSWAPPKGSRKVRVVYSGCTYNAGATSSTLTITAK
jgi:hypothetical protein